uniref:Uncharacterized protein n=1 Tax=Parastrongyloides trichosuri TaxID=131310 RepID=A0A0N4ZRG2_PARTI
MNNIFSQSFKRLCSDGHVQRIIRNKPGKPFRIHETKTAGITQRWNYRSEIVQKDKLDKDHLYIWMAFGFLSVFGALSFITIKSSVVEGRREEMLMREKLRKELKLTGEERKKIGLMNNSIES